MTPRCSAQTAAIPGGPLFPSLIRFALLTSHFNCPANWGNAIMNARQLGQRHYESAFAASHGANEPRSSSNRRWLRRNGNEHSWAKQPCDDIEDFAHSIVDGRWCHAQLRTSARCFRSHVNVAGPVRHSGVNTTTIGVSAHLSWGERAHSWGEPRSWVSATPAVVVDKQPLSPNHCGTCVSPTWPCSCTPV